jgi:hypothetical protein
MRLFEAKQVEVDTLYTRKTQIPQYTPSKDKPPIEGLVDYEKYSKLIKHINDSNVSDEEKKFLRFCAARHLVFNYSLIADYYAHAEPEMQRLMEESALVILDIDNAIANGYIKLTKELTDIIHGEDNEN